MADSDFPTQAPGWRQPGGRAGNASDHPIRTDGVSAREAVELAEGLTQAVGQLLRMFGTGRSEDVVAAVDSAMRWLDYEPIKEFGVSIDVNDLLDETQAQIAAARQIIEQVDHLATAYDEKPPAEGEAVLDETNLTPAILDSALAEPTARLAEVLDRPLEEVRAAVGAVLLGEREYLAELGLELPEDAVAAQIAAESLDDTPANRILACAVVLEQEVASLLEQDATDSDETAESTEEPPEADPAPEAPAEPQDAEEDAESAEEAGDEPQDPEPGQEAAPEPETPDESPDEGDTDEPAPATDPEVAEAESPVDEEAGDTIESSDEEVAD